MLLFGACPRCRGDVARVEELNDSYFSCLQCGFMAYTWPPLALPVRRPAA